MKNKSSFFLLEIILEFPLASLSIVFIALNLILAVVFTNKIFSFEYRQLHPLIDMFWTSRYVNRGLPLGQDCVFIPFVLIDVLKRNSKIGRIIVFILLVPTIFFEIYLISLLVGN